MLCLILKFSFKPPDSIPLLQGHIYIYIYIYRVSQEECARLREGVPYVKLYRCNPKHLCPKLNGYGDIYVYIWPSFNKFCTGNNFKFPNNGSISV